MKPASRRVTTSTRAAEVTARREEVRGISRGVSIRVGTLAG
jgi:hypothetical protein